MAVRWLYPAPTFVSSLLVLWGATAVADWMGT